ncbi:MAG TPA: hypothetical protein VH575_26835 [Gemmataceae bacterium]|jgi:hypothetical protein
MQIVIHVMARPSLRESLREIVIADLQKWDYQLEIEREKKVGRRNGWAKIKARDLAGAINIYWHANSKTLIVRVVGRQGTPGELVGRFISYLLHHRRKDVSSVAIRTM